MYIDFKCYNKIVLYNLFSILLMKKTQLASSSSAALINKYKENTTATAIGVESGRLSSTKKANVNSSSHQ